MQNGNMNFEDLMIDYLSGNISDIDLQCLFDLLKSDTDFKIKFDEMVKLRAVSFIDQIESGKQENYKRLLGQISSVPTFSMSQSLSRNFRRIAAVITLVISISVASFYIYKDVISPNDSAICFETVAQKGSQAKIILPDSTVVWLNSGSSLKYNQSFGKKNREVILLGEGYFEVKKDKGKPFLVHSTELDVKVMGTVFNVKAYKEDNEVVVDLIEGSVEVSLPENKNCGSFKMKPNEKIVFNKQTKKIESSDTDASRSALWTTGKLCFVDATIEKITKDLERKYNVKIKISNEQIKKEIFSGSLNLDISLKDILSYIDVDKKFKINQVGDTILIDVK
jgi:ferric-dicitrate binding protein FerR (iron transport regulator)